ncbi:MAG: uroporphyrinogen decarboxylase family protein [Candidatus Coatesbacteria bacterium]|nr:uroporphyrinogen decarboxylase family protein [Candidatus Coatesbacteria bacterium]
MTEKPSGRDYVKAAFKRERLERFCTYPVLGAVNAKFSGITIREFLTDASKFAAAQLEAYERFEPDIIVMMADLVMEPEAMGQHVDFFDDRMCQQRGYLVGEKAKLANLKIPNPMADARMPYYLEACTRVAEARIPAALGGVINGPWSLACELRGAENLLLDTFDDPEFVKSLMEFTTEVCKAFGTEVAKTGAGLSLSEAPASCSLISPSIYAEFVASYHKQVVDHFKAEKKAMTIHVCGYIDPIMQMLVDTGVAAISFDAPSSLERMLSIANEKTVVIGNAPTTIFLKEDKDAIFKEVQKCRDIANGAKAYVLASGCEVPIPATAKSIEYFMEAAKQTWSP